jgi:hypothetical protein
MSSVATAGEGGIESPSRGSTFLQGADGAVSQGGSHKSKVTRLSLCFLLIILHSRSHQFALMMDAQNEKLFDEKVF